MRSRRTNSCPSGTKCSPGSKRSRARDDLQEPDRSSSSTPRSSHRGAAAVVARKITLGSIKLLSQNEWWALQGGISPNLDKAVDWIDRRIYVLDSTPGGTSSSGNGPLAIDLDCRQFEFVCRAAQGLTSRSFFQADIRRIMAQLADLAEGAPATDEITVLLNGRSAQLVIHVGNVIQATVV